MRIPSVLRLTCFSSAASCRPTRHAIKSRGSWRCSADLRPCENVDERNRLLAAALEIQQFCDRQGWRYCFIGGIAVQHWGEARITRDADLTVFTGIGDEPHYVDAFLGHFQSRVEAPREFALSRRVLLLRASNDTPIDVSLGALGFEEKAVSTSTLEEITQGTWLRLCSPSALVVFKAFAGREQDWLDLKGIVHKSRNRVDWNEVRRDLRELLDLKGESDSETIKRLEALVSGGR